MFFFFGTYIRSILPSFPFLHVLTVFFFFFLNSVRNARLFVEPKGLRERPGGVSEVSQQRRECAQKEGLLHVLLRADNPAELAQGAQVQHLWLRPGNE